MTDEIRKLLTHALYYALEDDCTRDVCETRMKGVLFDQEHLTEEQIENSYANITKVLDALEM